MVNDQFKDYFNINFKVIKQQMKWDYYIWWTKKGWG